MRNMIVKSAGGLMFIASGLAGALASTLFDPVIQALPDIPLVVQGDLTRRDEHGDAEKVLRVEMVLDWKAEVPTARYTVRDAFGDTLEHLAITWRHPGSPEYQYLEGSPLRAAPLPPLNQSIQATDVTWLDLSLSFLWWTGGVRQGEADVRGRLCDVVDVSAPEGYPADFDGMRLWLDRKIGVVMRAEGYDRAGALVRRMDVKSFKKINGRWVIKDIEFQSFPDKTKTGLRVHDVKERERFELPER